MKYYDKDGNEVKRISKNVYIKELFNEDGIKVVRQKHVGCDMPGCFGWMARTMEEGCPSCGT